MRNSLLLSAAVAALLGAGAQAEALTGTLKKAADTGIILFQDTSLVYVVGATDLLGAADKVAHRDNTLVEMYLAVAVLYLVSSFTLSRLVKRLHAKIAIIR